MKRTLGPAVPLTSRSDGKWTLPPAGQRSSPRTERTLECRRSRSTHGSKLRHPYGIGIANRKP